MDEGQMPELPDANEILKSYENEMNGPRIDKEQLEALEKAMGMNGLVIRSIVTISLSALVFAMAGGMLGWFLGLMIPDYYRAVLHGSLLGVEANPAHVGLGLGVTQGAVAGIVIGCVAILAAAIYRSRMRGVIMNQVAGRLGGAYPGDHSAE